MNNKINSSLERNTFQYNQYIKRCQDNDEPVSDAYVELFKSAKQQDQENMANPEWRRNNLEYDLRSTEWICNKAKQSSTYAQNLYAALCSNDFLKLEVVTILKNDLWHCSWRYAGGIVADMREQGDYIDWYCSGMIDIDEHAGDIMREGRVTEEIRMDLKDLGWVVVDSDNGDV